MLGPEDQNHHTEHAGAAWLEGVLRTVLEPAHHELDLVGRIVCSQFGIAWRIACFTDQGPRGVGHPPRGYPRDRTGEPGNEWVLLERVEPRPGMNKRRIVSLQELEQMLDRSRVAA